MSETASNQARRSRWMDWKPNTGKAVDSAASEPTKPSKPSSVGFEGATPVESPVIRTKPDPEDFAPCGSPTCQGCYEVAPGVRIHPPKISPEWQARFDKWRPKGERVQ